ncbi:MAG: dihydropteroate synthase [Alphaproteobacteria bacterium]|jgi:dihydropteroate synthase|nr:dihydropteroate synthase [Alphaproteobacteria bacterium]
MTASSPHDKAWPEIGADARVYLRPVIPANGLSLDQFELILSSSGGRATRRRVSRGDVEAGAAQAGAAARQRIAEQMARIDAAAGTICGIGLRQPRIMGVLNVTPDSFSDGGKHYDSRAAIDAGMAMHQAGAHIIDVGGVSTRPGSSAPGEAEELARVLPVIEALAPAGLILSVDTRRAAVMDAALKAGAKIINDVSALTADPASLGLAAGRAAPVILMHMQGSPESMQKAPAYGDVSLDIFDYLEARIAVCETAGIPRQRLIVDPGIGFGKTAAHNLQILRDISLFRALGCALMIGLSRKYFIARLSAGEAAEARMAGSVAGALYAISQGVQIVRVHDVRETAQAFKVWQAINSDVLDTEST